MRLHLAKRPPTANFELYFPEVNPETVPVRALSDTLSAVHRLAFPEDLDIDAGDIEEGAGEEERKRIAVRVLRIRRGSAAYACVADRPDVFIQNLRRAGSAIRGNSAADLQLASVSPLRTLSQIAKALETAIAIREPGGSAEVIRIEPSTYEGIAESLLVRGRKTLVGEVARVGGATAPRCALRVEGRARLLFCAVKGEDTIQQLARHLYKEAVVTGEATWLRHNWRVVDFEIEAVEELPQEPLSAAFDALREAGGDAWDSIADPSAFLDEVSGV